MKTLKANNKEIKEAINEHILNSVYDFEGQPFKSLDEAKEHIKSEFNRVANYPNNLIRIPNNQNRFSDYLNGLPFNFYFYYSDIKDYLNSIGLIKEDATDEQSNKLYHYLIFKSVFKV